MGKTPETALERQTRRFVYIHGFDGRGPERYHAMMGEELRRYGAIRGRAVVATPSAPAGPEGSVAWTVEGEAICDVLFLGWQDEVRTTMRRPIGTRLWRGLGAALEIGFGGVALRMARANWPTGAFMAYPTFAALILIALILGPAIWLATASTWIWLLAIPFWAVLIHHLTRRVERSTYFWYLINDFTAIRDFARNRDAGMERRVDAFADALAALIDEAPRDEDIIIYGHSSGAFVALRALDRLISKRPDIGADRPRPPMFLTLGSGLGYPAFFTGATTAAEAERVIASNLFFWSDVYSLVDPVCSGKFNPLKEFGIASRGLGRPHHINARFRESLAPEVYGAAKRSFFDFHFLYLRAMSDPAAFDLYDLMVGPDPWPQVLRPKAAATFSEGGVIADTSRSKS